MPPIDPNNPSKDSAGLRRTLGLFSLIAYGIGDILGAGIYALVGKVAGLVGSACWLAFGFSFFVAWLTGLTYAELGARYPRSAGASLYSLKAFRSPVLSYFIGFLVLMSGVVSMATVSHAFAGYVRALWPAVPSWAVVVSFLVVLSIINFRGMQESSLTNVFCTAIEISGLVVVIFAGLRFFGSVDYFEITPAAGKAPVTAFFQAGMLAFYAFIGFEDMANVAEEVRQPEKFIPRAIVTALIVVAVFYIVTALAAVSAVPSETLSASSAPLMDVVRKGAPWLPSEIFTLIALFAVTNTALVNFIMGSRLLYGMASEGLVPRALARVHPTRHTPHVAIAVVLVLALTLALTGTLVVLAQSNSFILLNVYFVMNLSLIAVRMRKGEPSPAFQVPLFVPVLGCLSCLFLASFVQQQALATVGVLLGLGLATYGLMQIPFSRNGIFPNVPGSAE